MSHGVYIFTVIFFFTVNIFFFYSCKNTQAVFDKCVLDKMGLERPHFGWQAEAHFHYTKRPKPKEEITYYTDVPDKLPDEKVKHPDPKFGVRFME